MADNNIGQAFLDTFDDKSEENPTLTKDEKESIGGAFASPEELGNALPLISERVNNMKERIEHSDKNIKMWQETKKMWTGRKDQLLEILGQTMERLNVAGNIIKSADCKLSTSTRTSLEVDEDWLINQYAALAGSMQSQLPPYVTLKLTVDKTKLAAYLKTDDTLLIDHPDRVHTKVSKSVTLSTKKASKGTTA